MMKNFTEIKPLCYWVQHILPLVYDDSLSYMEVLGRVTIRLNELIENNNEMPDYIRELIKEYIDSGEIEKVLSEVLANYMLNVKFPPEGLTPASGDGTKDDTEAIQGCIDYAFSQGGMCVYFPSGKYLTQSLTLKNNVALSGFDRSTTVIVLKGGAISPLISGSCKNNTLSRLSFDGNMDIQVNNIDTVVLTGSEYIVENCYFTDGYTLLTFNLDGGLELTNCKFGKAVYEHLLVTGHGNVVANNLLFEFLSVLNGKYIIENLVDNAQYTNIYSVANVDTAIKNSANNSVFVGQVLNSTHTHLNVGINNYYNFYSRGGTINDLINDEKTERLEADNVLHSNIENEKNARENADNVLQNNITNEELSRINSDNVLQQNINSLKDIVFLDDHNSKNVKQFGAIGDGITDDTTAIQSAIDSVVNGGVIYFPSGKYKITQTLNIEKPRNGNGFTIMGNGDDSVLLHSFTDNLFNFTEWTSLINVRNIRITCTVRQTSGSAFYFLNGVYQASFINCRYDLDNEEELSNRHYPWSFFNCPNAVTTDTIAFINCYIEHVDGPCYHLGRGSSVWVTGGRVIGTGFTENRETSIGLLFTGDMGGVYLTSVDIIACHIGLHSTNEIEAQNREYFINNVTFDGNDTGVLIADDVFISLSNVWLCTSKNSCFQVLEGSNPEIVQTGGTVSMGGVATSGIGNGMIIAGGSATITGVKFGYNGGTSLYMHGSTPERRNLVSNCQFYNNFFVMDIADYAFIHGNSAYNNTTPESNINISGGGVVLLDNIGISIVNPTPVIPDSGISVVNNFGGRFMVAVDGIETTDVYVNGVKAGNASCTVVLKPGDFISLGYVTAPTWTWFNI